MTIIISITAFLSLAGAAVSIWSFINTRTKYYKDYIDKLESKND